MSDECLPTWLDVPRETVESWQRYAELLLSENGRQNLISAATVATAWERHILDSAQLLSLAPPGARSWLDLGSGAGLPGLVIAAAVEAEVTLVESRRLRHEFLSSAAETLSLSNVTVIPTRLESAPTAAYDVMVARAFAPLDRLLHLAARFAHPGTRWLLPRGRRGGEELAAASRLWQGSFRTVSSRTDGQSVIVVLDGVPRLKGKRA